ncbi:acyl-CoA dehydrogenase family protein [Sphingomonas crocodyli]|uniref:Acyl-CoA dehydrogenase n=1 Tax=Sphingomonas crocodyli TaxID=1979270 RepID=A0A437MA00_9SPHN|nr:acyl-CoA dehydrogenase family protein [Sphingomonas crocodyli]RVT94454.1 acyl-CoA dehydrogenase [Sphingomonas crocodyli]
MSELDDFRAETRAWLEANCPQSRRGAFRGFSTFNYWGGRKAEFQDEDQKVWFERMRDKGWTVPEWPVEYGGAGLDKHRAGILQQELRRIQAQPPLQSLGIWMLGPALLHFGTPEQKAEHLPKIARGEIRWAQGYSEPGAGSDLASLSTKGELKDGQWVINGSKIWTTNGDKCDMIFALVRTEPDAPKHQGISFILVDMDQPGVTTKPITLINGDAPFVQTFFDNATAPEGNVVGPRGKGWDVTKYLLGHEREMIGSSMTNSVTETVSSVAKAKLGADGLKADPSLRMAIANHEIESWVLGIAVERLKDMGKAKQFSQFAPSVLKLMGTELNYRRGELLMSISGFDAVNDLFSEPVHSYLHAPANCIAGGSNEVQLNILSKRALGLPEL